MFRIRRFFEDINIENIYLTYRYTVSNTGDHTERRINLSFTRKCEQNFVSRNELVSQVLVDRILDIHYADRRGHQDDSDIFDDYSRSSMSSAEYYLENHIIDFYRILFFFSELRSRGIVQTMIKIKIV